MISAYSGPTEGPWKPPYPTSKYLPPQAHTAWNPTISNSGVDSR